jgi:hypothetical protein
MADVLIRDVPEDRRTTVADVARSAEISADVVGTPGTGPRRFVRCFVRAADDAALPADPALRASLRAYMEWAVAEVMSYSPPGSRVGADLPVPRWSWDGPAAAPAAPSGRR